MGSLLKEVVKTHHDKTEKRYSVRLPWKLSRRRGCLFLFTTQRSDVRLYVQLGCPLGQRKDKDREIFLHYRSASIKSTKQYAAGKYESVA